MLTVYESLILELKSKLKNKNIKSKHLISLINNQNYNENFIIIYDNDIHSLIENIIIEREKIGSNMEIKLNDLVWLNERLIQFGEEPQPSKTKALKILKTIAINIYDLESEQYKKRTTFKELIKDLQKNPERHFPLCSAKKDGALKCFLVKYRRSCKLKRN
jgi:hypothetical protein